MEQNQEINSNNVYRFIRGDVWDIALYDLNDNGDNFVREFLREPKYNVKDADITYRLIHTWSKDGLLNDSRPEGSSSWRKLTFVEIIWIRVLNELRKYGLSKNQLRESFRTAFNFYPKDNQASLFEVAICLVLQKQPVTLFILNDGWLEPLLEKEILLNMTLNLHSSYLQVNLNYLMKEIFPKIKKHNIDIPTYLTDKEAEIISSLKESELKKLSVLLKNGEITELEKHFDNKVNNITDELCKEVEFGSIRVKIHKGKISLVEVIEKRII